MLISERMQNLAVEIEAELGRARAKFPSAFNLNMALQEEVGEFARAQMQQLGWAKIRTEGIQVIAMVIRIIEEEDQSLVVTKETVKK